LAAIPIAAPARAAPMSGPLSPQEKALELERFEPLRLVSPPLLRLRLVVLLLRLRLLLFRLLVRVAITVSIICRGSTSDQRPRCVQASAYSTA
jgi:hypothetical protein